MRIHVSIGLLAGFLVIAGCQSTKQNIASSPSSTNSPCGGNHKLEKTAHNQSGIVRYNSEDKQYQIVVTSSNTVDSQEIGIVCNLPKNLQNDGLKVVFDGEYRTYDKTPKTMLGGQSFYYLSIRKLTFEKGNL